LLSSSLQDPQEESNSNKSPFFYSLQHPLEEKAMAIAIAFFFSTRLATKEGHNIVTVFFS
jgi:hypothetical protein